MSRALAELQAMCERKGSMPCRVIRLWPNDLPADQIHLQGFYWCQLDNARMHAVKEGRIFLGLTLSDAQNTLLNLKLPKVKQHVTS